MKSKSENVKWLVLIIVTLGALMIFSMLDNKKDDVDMVVGIHIKGEVNYPGYYELEYGSRVKDAIDFAGGKTEIADTDSVNLAMKLFDGQEVVIPSKGAASEESPQKGKSDAEEEKININQADKNTLCKLEGIGESTAQAIIDYRTSKGAFKSAREITKIKGIGQSKYNSLKDKITV